MAREKTPYDAGNPYDPRLIPEHQVLADKSAILAANRGSDRIIRAGEQYIATCRCGAAEVTSSEKVLARFRMEHGHG